MNWQNPGTYTVLGALISVVTTIIYQEIRRRVEKRSREEANQRRTQGAALLVWDELRANIVQLEISQQTNALPALESQSYQDLQTDLALGLPMNIMNAVRAAYVYARVPQSLITRRPVGDRMVPLPNQLVQDALDRAIRARDLLQPLLPPGTEDI